MIRHEQVRGKVPKFKTFLSSHGAQVLNPTNEWELVRFLAGGETGIIYRNKRGDVTFVGPAEAAFNAFASGQAWRVDPYNRAKVRIKPVVATLRARDGDLCFFCALAMGDDATVEHLVARAHGGPNHVSNLFLAHGACNQKAGHLSAPEKIAMHVASRFRIERAA